MLIIWGASGISTTIIDSDRDGIGVFSSNETFGYTVTEGDQLMTVRGKSINLMDWHRLEWIPCGSIFKITVYLIRNVNAFDEQIGVRFGKIIRNASKESDDWKKEHRLMLQQMDY